jgi:beta-lactamase regulating signal transducer with metallopeptidase domain
MTDRLAWISTTDIRYVAWTLLHFLWQATLLGGLFAALNAIVRSATVRYALAVSVLILMIAAPIATFFYLRAADTDQVSVAQASAPIALAPRVAHDSSLQRVPSEPVSPDTLMWVVNLWIAGVAVFSLRTAGGLLIVERLRLSKAHPVAPRLLETCVDIQRRIGIKRAIRFCQCNGLDVPAVVGWFRPVVLLPMTVLTGLSEAQLEAVLAHELAHIKRADYLVNLLQIGAETVLFYHPAVWWLSHRIRVERENCCDDMAVRLCGNVVDYARALTYMEGGRTAPSVALALSGSPLKLRVLRLLGRNSGERVVSTGLVIGALCLASGLFASQAVIRVAHADSSKAPQTPQTVSRQTPPTPPAAADSPSAILPAIAAPPAAPPAPRAAPAAVPLVAPVAPVSEVPEVAEVQETPSTPATNETSYIDGMKAVGLNNLSVDDLVAMKIQGVTPDYVRQLQAEGLKPNADELVALRVQGVTPEYIRSMRAAGINANADDLIAMKVQDVTPEYIRSMHDLGLKVNGDDLVGMRVQGVTPEYVREIRALGLNPSADDLMGMRIQGVTPAYIKSLSAAGLTKLDSDDIMSAKIQGITPEFIEKARQHGFQNLTLDQLMSLKHAGVL